MKRTKRTNIKTETRELLIVHRVNRSIYLAWCDECQKQIQWLSLAQTAKLSGLHIREIFRFIEAGEVHFQETTAGDVFVCPNSPAITKSESKRNWIPP